MEKKFVAKRTVSINAPVSQVWRALTDPKLVKQYFFGVDVITDWKQGSPIIYRGVWEGKPFEDKGNVLKIEPEKLLLTTHWSPLSGVPDTPENYHNVRYELAPEGRGTKLTITQDNNATAEEKNHSEQNWGAVLDGMKRVLEK